MKNLKQVLFHQLKDLYSAENQLVKALPKMEKGASSPALKSGFKTHLQETKKQVERLERAGKVVQPERSLGGHKCKAMEGLIKEGSEILKEDLDDENLRDVLLVAAAQRVEHYEMAGYGNAIALAKVLGLEKVVKELSVTLQEEEACDQTLTEICQAKIFPNCEIDEQSLPQAANN